MIPKGYLSTIFHWAWDGLAWFKLLVGLMLVGSAGCEDGKGKDEYDLLHESNLKFFLGLGD
jgi:hypothetical protein